MIKDKEKFWEFLRNYGIGKIKYKKETPPFEFEILPLNKVDSYEYDDFVFNINHVMIIYEELINTEKLIESKVNLRHQLLCEIILTLLITSLEVFLTNTFESLSIVNLIENLDKSKLVDFVKEFNVEKKFFNALKEKGDLQIQLVNIIPERLDLQQKDKSKIAFTLVGIDLPKLEHELWKKNFARKEAKSYIQIRHRIVHRGVSRLLRDRKQALDLDFIETAIFDIVKFVYQIENERNLRYASEVEEYIEFEDETEDKDK